MRLVYLLKLHTQIHISFLPLARRRLKNVYMKMDIHAILRRQCEITNKDELSHLRI